MTSGEDKSATCRGMDNSCVGKCPTRRLRQPPLGHVALSPSPPWRRGGTAAGFGEFLHSCTLKLSGLIYQEALFFGVCATQGSITFSTSSFLHLGQRIFLVSCSLT